MNTADGADSTSGAFTRSEYRKGALDEAGVAADPLVQFGAWLEEARAALASDEAHAMTLATVGDDTRPSARIVLLRGYDDRGLVFFTNYESRKGRELAAHPCAALVFYWAPLQRQIRIEGDVRPLQAADSDAYFAQRPRGHRLSAWASKQSAPLASRAALEAQIAHAEERFGDGEIPRPAYWGGYRLTPHAFEFWQGRPDRAHDRLAYRRDGTAWRISRLSP